MFQSIIAGKPIDSSKEYSYFEVEIENMPNPSTIVSIGFSTDVNYVNTMAPGFYPGSVGFQSSVDKCEAIMGNKSLITFDFSIKYGEVFGFELSL